MPGRAGIATPLAKRPSKSFPAPDSQAISDASSRLRTQNRRDGRASEANRSLTRTRRGRHSAAGMQVGTRAGFRHTFRVDAKARPRPDNRRTLQQLYRSEIAVRTMPVSTVMAPNIRLRFCAFVASNMGLVSWHSVSTLARTGAIPTWSPLPMPRCPFSVPSRS